jgi:hypothetical protein
MLISWFALLLYPQQQLFSQNSVGREWESVLETLLSGDEELSSDAREELLMLYESLHSEPLNINTATRDQLRELMFLSDRQIEDIHAYVYLHGPMKTLGELQLTGSLDFDTRRLLRQFVYAGDVPAGKSSLELKDILSHGRNELTARMDIPLYMRDGFRYHSPQELERYPNRAYMGSRLSHSVRYSFNWQNRIRLGLCADKDAGEPFLGRNCTGYDFYSPYLYLKDIGMIKELALGNFKAQYGLGLLLGGGFSVGKSMSMTNMQRSTQGLKPHSSTQEYGYLSGVGVAVGWGHTTVTLLGAYTAFDATIKGDTVISSFKQDGYHRTGLEWSKKHNAQMSTCAANMRYSYRGLQIGTTALYERLSKPYKGQDLFWGLSANLSLGRPRYALAAELSVAGLKPAFICSQTLRLPGSWTLTSIVRAYSPDYRSFHSNAMAEGDVMNETGLLTGLSYSRRGLKVNGYADLFMFPDPRYGASDRSNGMDLRLETDWKIGRRDALYATARFKAKQKDCKYTGQLEYCLTGRYRLRWTHSCAGGAELKTQLLFTRYDFIAEPIADGWAVTHSYSRSLFSDRVDLNISGALFCTDSYDSNVSVYEGGLRYAYGFLTLSGRGARLAMTLKWNVSGSLQLNLKAGGTWYADRDEISSAQQRIEACHKEDVSLQLISKF